MNDGTYVCIHCVASGSVLLKSKRWYPIGKVQYEIWLLKSLKSPCQVDTLILTWPQYNAPDEKFVSQYSKIATRTSELMGIGMAPWVTSPSNHIWLFCSGVFKDMIIIYMYIYIYMYTFNKLSKCVHTCVFVYSQPVWSAITQLKKSTHVCMKFVFRWATCSSIHQY